MQIDILPGAIVRDVQSKFNRRFPFLRLDFFAHQNAHIVYDPEHRVNDERKTLGEINKSLHGGMVIISGNEKVSTLERTFREHFGLAVQVSRRSGKIWVLTTATDDLSLNQQNALGEEMSKNIEPEEPMDIHERE